MAIYEELPGGSLKLVAAKLLSPDLSATTPYKFEFTDIDAPSAANPYIVKAFAWDSLLTLRPLSDPQMRELNVISISH